MDVTEAGLVRLRSQFRVSSATGAVIITLIAPVWRYNSMLVFLWPFVARINAHIVFPLPAAVSEDSSSEEEAGQEGQAEQVCRLYLILLVHSWPAVVEAGRLRWQRLTALWSTHRLVGYSCACHITSDTFLTNTLT